MAETDEKQEPVEVPSGTDEGQSVQQSQTTGKVSKDAVNMAMLCHLLAIFTGFLGPLIIWLIKKEDSSFVDDQGKEALNFQITVLIAMVVSGLLIFACIGTFLMPIVYVLDLVFCIIAAVKASRGEAYRYPLTFRFIK
jgi:uncharacterized Tic20 family protein